MSGAISGELVRQLLVVAVVLSLVILPPQVAHAWLNYYIVLTSLGLVTIYNWYGKRRNANPFLADIALATACGLAPILGATISGHLITRWTVFLGVYYSAFIALINGVHGALRDLEHEIKQEVKTTAVILGARTQDGVLILSKKVCIYCTTLHGLLCVQVLSELFDPRLVNASWRLMAAASTLLVGLVIFSSWSLYVAWWFSGRNKQVAAAFGTIHMILVFMAPWTLFVAFGAPWRTVAVIIAGVCPLACHSWFRSVAPMAVGRCMPRRQRKLAEG